MGWSYKSLERIHKKKDLFKNKKVLTLGTLYPFLNDSELHRLKELGVNTNTNKIDFTRKFFCDFIKAESCHYLDVSDYQESEIICNLNFPIKEELKGKYDVIVDAGTLEHVSNMSTGLMNIFDLLKKDGILYFGNPCNNWINHGFFQFSPTFFKDLCIDNENLELRELFLTDNSNYFDITNSEVNGYFNRVIYASNNKFNVVGIIKKLNDDISLDLVQSKYRSLYEFNDSSAYEMVSSINEGLFFKFKELSLNLFFWFLAIPFVNIKYKYDLINLLYKLKKNFS